MAILLLLAAIGLLLKLQPSGSKPLPFASVKRNMLVSIRISKGSEAITLRKAETGWVAEAAKGTYTADTARIIPLLAITEEMEGIPVSVYAQSHSTFGVDEASGTILALTDRCDSTLLSVLVGKRSPDSKSTYIRPSSSESVYAVPGFPREYLQADVDFYRDRTILGFAPDDLDTLRLIYPEKALTFSRDSMGNLILVHPENSSFDSTALKRAVRALSMLRATGFADGKRSREAGLVSPRLNVVLILRTGKVLNLQVGDAKDNAYYARKVGDPVTYLINRMITEKFYRPYESYNDR
jgi:hypothetical protein